MKLGNYGFFLTHEDKIYRNGIYKMYINMTNLNDKKLSKKG